MSGIFYDDNDNLLQLTGLKSQATGAYVNDATVSVTLKDVDGNNISGQSWPTTMSYVSGSNGNYIATLEYDLDVTLYQSIVAHITGLAGGRTFNIQFVMNVAERTS